MQGVKKMSGLRNFTCIPFKNMVYSARTQRRRCSSVVEQRIRNAWVVSSNLTSGSDSPFGWVAMCGIPRHCASVAQLVEQLTLNQFVRGSSPRGGTGPGMLFRRAS